jgi:hypothetical protein
VVVTMLERSAATESAPEDATFLAAARRPLAGVVAAKETVALLVLVACGGENLDEVGTGGPVSRDACAESARLERLVIADFDTAPGAAYAFGSDNTTTDITVEPMAPLDAPKCPGDAGGSAFHFIGRGFQGFGYNFGYNALGTLSGGGAYLDVSAWTGLSMWVRKGSGPSASVIFASVADRYTVPAGGALFSGAELELLLDPADCPADQMPAGVCYCAFNAADVNGDNIADPLLSQCDRFGVGIGISHEWRFFKIPFERMRQRAYGRPSQLTRPDVNLFGIEIGLDGDDWDFWLDDLAFYRDPADEAVGGP